MTKPQRPTKHPRARQTARPRGGTGTRRPSVSEEEGDLYQQVFEDANDMIAVLTLDGVITKVNRAVERLLGWRPETLIGEHYRKVVTPAALQWLEERRQRLLAGDKLPSRPYELDLQHREERTIRVEARTQVIRDAAGKPLRVYGIFRDLSARQHAEAMLREVADTVRDVIYVIAHDGTLTYLSPSFAHVTGWSLDEWQGQPFLPIVHAEDQNFAAEMFVRLLAREKVEDFEMRIMTKSGDFLYGEFSATTQIRNEEVTGVLGIGRDVTKRKLVEEQLRQSELLRTRIVETMPDVLYVYDVSAGQFAYLNSQVYAVLGYHPDEVRALSPRQLQDLLPEQDRTRIIKVHEQFVTSSEERVIEVEYPVKHRNGEWRWLYSRTTALKRTVEGRPHELLGLAHDITERKRLEERLQAQAIQPEDMPTNLRKFRERLQMTQPEFGREFGGFNQRQMSGYETGQIDIPIELLLAIRAKGFPLDAILGNRPTAVMEKTALYFSTMFATKTLEQELAATLAAVLTRDVTAIERALQELNLPTRSLGSGEKQLLEHLRGLQKKETEG